MLIIFISTSITLIILDVKMRIINTISNMYITMFKSTHLCGLAGVRLQLAVPLVQYERRIGRAGCCGGFMAQWLWWLQSDTLGSSPTVVGFSLFSFLLKQVEFQLNFYKICIVFIFGRISHVTMFLSMSHQMYNVSSTCTSSGTMTMLKNLDNNLYTVKNLWVNLFLAILKIIFIVKTCSQDRITPLLW